VSQSYGLYQISSPWKPVGYKDYKYGGVVSNHQTGGSVDFVMTPAQHASLKVLIDMKPNTHKHDTWENLLGLKLFRTPEPYYVVAMNYNCFKLWCEVRNLRTNLDAKFVYHPRGLRGLRPGSKIVFVCDWTDGKPWEAVQDTLEQVHVLRQMGTFTAYDNCSPNIEMEEPVDEDPEKFHFHVGTTDPQELIGWLVMEHGLAQHQAEAAVDLLIEGLLTPTTVSNQIPNLDHALPLVVHKGEYKPKKTITPDQAKLTPYTANSGASYTDEDHPMTGALVKAIPALKTAKAKCPVRKNKGKTFCSMPRTNYVVNLVVHLNDTHKWTREAIADWLETLDCDLSFQNPESEEADEHHGEADSQDHGGDLAGGDPGPEGGTG